MRSHLSGAAATGQGPLPRRAARSCTSAAATAKRSKAAAASSARLQPASPEHRQASNAHGSTWVTPSPIYPPGRRSRIVLAQRNWCWNISPKLAPRQRGLHHQRRKHHVEAGARNAISQLVIIRQVIQQRTQSTDSLQRFAPHRQGRTQPEAQPAFQRVGAQHASGEIGCDRKRLQPRSQGRRRAEPPLCFVGLLCSRTIQSRHHPRAAARGFLPASRSMPRFAAGNPAAPGCRCR